MLTLRHRPSALTAALCLLLFGLAAHADPPRPAQPAWIDPLGGWAGIGGGMLYARVHKGAPIAKPKPKESNFKRLEETLQALELHALKDAKVTITGLKGVDSATANDHGFIALALPGNLVPGPLQVQLQVKGPDFESAPTPLTIQVWDDQPGLGIVSDIDDTLTDTGVTHKTKMLMGTFFHSEFEVKLFPGAPAAMKALSVSQPGLSARCLFFLSGSPWGLHERISDAFDLAGMPHGVMILRSLSKEKMDAYEFKHPHLQALFKAFPHRKWLLLGDSGEKDPEVYSQMRTEHPEQIEHIYIHNVTKASPTSPRFKDMTVFTDWSELAKDIAKRGYTAAAAPAK